MKIILVTGGAGYVGSALVPKLLADGYRVVVLDLFLYGDVLRPNPKLELVRADLRDRRVVSHTLAGIDTVIHLASISNDPSYELDPTLGKSINYDATKQLIDLANEVGVRRFIFASTSSVYGVKKEKEVTEELSLEPLTDYSKYKAIAETYLLRKQSQKFSVVVVRPATVCGWAPRLRLDLTVNLLTIQALATGEMIIFGGKQTRPNIHIDDMVDAYRLLVRAPQKKIAGEIFNVGYQNLSLLEIAYMIRRLLKDKKVKISIRPTNDTRSYRISSAKIKKILGFVPKRTVEDAISDLARSFRLGEIPAPLQDKRYVNIKTMKAIHLQ